MLSRDEVIGLLAKEHGILISRDDPILTFLSVHQVLMEEYARTIGSEAETANQSFTQSLAEAQNHYQEQSKTLANQVIGTAVNEFVAAEKRLAEKLQQFELAKNANEPQLQQLSARLLRMEIGLICCALLTIGVFIMEVVK